MVLSLGPGKFYGSSLPRPRFRDKEDRVDPPVSVLDPLLSWATDAHWSMGGLSFKRLRLQGKIEGNIQKLRKENEKEKRDHGGRFSPPIFESKAVNRSQDSPPRAPISKKKRRFAVLVDEDDETEVVRNLDYDFEREATQNAEIIPDGVARRTGSRRSMVMVEEDESDGGKNTKTAKIEQVKGSDSGSDSNLSGSRRSSRRLKKKSS